MNPDANAADDDIVVTADNKKERPRVADTGSVASFGTAVLSFAVPNIQMLQGDEAQIVVTGRKEVRTRKGYAVTVNIGLWRGAPYPVVPLSGSFTYTRPLDLVGKTKQCWADRGSLSLTSIDIRTTLEGGARGALSGGARGAATAAAIGWLGGGTELPAVLAGGAMGGLKGFGTGSLMSALQQACAGD